MKIPIDLPLMFFLILVLLATSVISKVPKATVLESRIVGGDDSAPNEFPFFASWYYEGSSHPSCGGSLIAPNLVLTAAHCEPVTGSIIVGCSNASGTNCLPRANVIKKIIHPRHTSLYFDYMILELDRDFNMITPVNLNLDSSAPEVDDMLTVVGFGKTSEDGETSSILQKVNVPVVDFETCRRQIGNYLVNQLHLCAGYPWGGKDACQGDSGNPLFREIGGVVTQFGVVSHGKGCARDDTSGVYARLSYVKDWLKLEICGRAHGALPSYCYHNPTPVPRLITFAPSAAPTPVPTRPPTRTPTRAPTTTPTSPPTLKASASPSVSPTLLPSVSPSESFLPTTSMSPTMSPSSKPSSQPSRSSSPSQFPSVSPTITISPSLAPSQSPTHTKMPTISSAPSVLPSQSKLPSTSPTISILPSTLPTLSPTTSTPSVSCVPCSDIPTPWMLSVKITCAESEFLIQRKCRKNQVWTSNNYCKYTCGEAGLGYSDERCCPSED